MSEPTRLRMTSGSLGGELLTAAALEAPSARAKHATMAALGIATGASLVAVGSAVSTTVSAASAVSGSAIGTGASAGTGTTLATTPLAATPLIAASGLGSAVTAGIASKGALAIVLSVLGASALAVAEAPRLMRAPSVTVGSEVRAPASSLPSAVGSLSYGDVVVSNVAIAPSSSTSVYYAPEAPPAVSGSPQGAPLRIAPDVATKPVITAAPAAVRISAEPAVVPTSASTDPSRGNFAQASRLGEEVRILDAARAALSRGDAALASAILDGHAREFPHGDLANEREVLRNDARAKLKK